jgi:hypothetical protein
MFVILVLLALNHSEADYMDDVIVQVGWSLASGEIDDKHLLEVILERSRSIQGE